MQEPNAANRILLVEDEEGIRSRIASALTGSGFEVSSCGTLAEARARLAEPIDLVLLDLGLPDGDGLEFCRELRDGGSELPIIAVTARDGSDQRVAGLEGGADDYVVKPFHLPELVARVRSVLRRAQPREEEETGEVIRIGPLWADPKMRTAGKGDQTFQLKRREFELLLFLMRNPGQVWTREQILDRVWEKGFSGGARTVDLHVRRLRTQIEDEPSDPRFLETAWGMGYRMNDGSNGDQP